MHHDLPSDTTPWINRRTVLAASAATLALGSAATLALGSLRDAIALLQAASAFSWR